ncbi:relaxase/mobilization nuclease domain-containing protein, partial [Lactococcus sp. dk322]|uniref:relaxase/mobilization nuclease domain-containing protein n=1 Tax=Lactococcus sp. dk322 TaxID=2603290 RepID=UPI0011CB20F9
MVYTKHLNVRSIKHMNTAVGYVENATKTVTTLKENEHLNSLFPYIINGDKTVEQQLVSGYQISDIYHANEEFLWTKQVALFSKGKDLALTEQDEKLKLDSRSFENNNATLAHHLIQSFSPEDNLTPEEIHEIGRKTVLELTGGNHEFVIATHVDKEHIHNHIVFNSTNLVTGNVFRWQRGTKRQLEQISDKYASQLGAKIIEKSPAGSHKKYTMWQTETLYKNKIKQRLDFLIEHSSSMNDFLEKAKALELSVDFSGKWATYKLTDQPQ